MNGDCFSNILTGFRSRYAKFRENLATVSVRIVQSKVIRYAAPENRQVEEIVAAQLWQHLVAQLDQSSFAEPFNSVLTGCLIY